MSVPIEQAEPNSDSRKECDLKRRDDLAQPRPWRADGLSIRDAKGNHVTLFCHWNIPLIIDAVNASEQAANNGFLHGAAWAIAVLIRHYELPTIALELLNEAGASIEALEAAETNEYDLSSIRQAIAKEKETNGQQSAT